MSTTCQASSDILAFNDEDIATIRRSDTTKKVLERDIDIGLECEISLADRSFRNGKLHVNNWRVGASDLCGACTFCKLLLDGLQRTLSSISCDWKIGRTGASNGSSTKTNLSFHFGKLEFSRVPTSWLNGYELESRGISLLVFHGEGINLRGASEDMGNRSDVEVIFELFAEKNSPFTELLNIYRRPLESTSLSALNVGKIRSWIEDCDVNHMNCWSDPPVAGSKGNGSETYFLPTRLLSIGKADMDHVHLIPTYRLRSGVSKSERINYLALSYCWGSAETSGSLLLTTHQTMDSRLQGIKTDIMPQVFKDAILIAHKLDIQYL
jgi:hypothetical protein